MSPFPNVAGHDSDCGHLIERGILRKSPPRSSVAVFVKMVAKNIAARFLDSVLKTTYGVKNS
jgi:hypothetical protein